MKRLLWVLTLLLAGCSRNGGEKQAIELTVWSMWSGQEEKNFEKVLRRYEQQHPGIHIRNLGAVNDDTKTIRALVAGVPPDFFTLADPSYLGPLARNQAIRPLDSLFQQSGLQTDRFVPASLALARYNGRLYGMPFLIDDYALLWDKKAFREAKLDPDRPPQTLEELADWAVKLTTFDKDGNIVRIGMRPTSDLYLIISLFGGRFIDPQTGRITADDPANIAAVKWYKRLVERMGGISKVRAFASGFGQEQGTNNPFYVGKIAMMFNGEWNPYWVSRYAPQMEYGVAPPPPPASRPDRVRTTWLGGNILCIPTESRHPEEVWKFFLWMQTQQAQVMFAHDMNNVPNSRQALKAPELRNGPPFRKKYSLYLDLADSPNAAFFPAIPVTSFYQNQLATAIDRILLDERTAEQALAEVRQRVQKELDQQ